MNERKPWDCHDCGLAYGKPGWCDTHIPNETWARISPTGDAGGILCISCIARRLVEAGIADVPLYVGSGPWDYDTVTHRRLATHREEWKP